MARIGDWGFEGGHNLMFSETSGLGVDLAGAITGQFGAQGNLGTGGRAILSLGSSYSELYVGKNFNSTFYNATGALYGWRKSGTVLGSIRFTTGRQLTLYVGTSQVATGTQVLVDNRTYNLQTRVKIGNTTTGTIQLKIDGNLDIDYSSQDTQPGSDTDIDEWQLGNTGIAIGGGVAHYDDLIINDTTGGFNDSWPGIRYIYPALTTGDSASNNAWSRSTGSNGYSLVDERPHNTTDYVYSGTNGQQQGFTHAASNAPSSSTVKAVRFDYVAYKVSDGQLKVGTRSSTTEDLSAAQNLGISPTVLTAYYENDPATSSPWASISAADVAESLVESVI